MDPNKKDKNDQYSFTYGFNDYQQPNQQKKQSNQTLKQYSQARVRQNSALKPVKGPQTKTRTPNTTQQQPNQQRSNSDNFYETLLQYESVLNPEQFRPYKQKIQRYISLMNWANLVGFGYLFYTFSVAQQKWWILTTKAHSVVPTAMFLLLGPVILGQRLKGYEHYRYYKKNQIELQALLTKQDKQKMNLAKFLKSHG